MASRTVRPKNKTYGTIQRGSSLTIPVFIKDSFDKPLDLTDCTASFTVKAVQYDYDREDVRAYIQKDLVPQEPLQGRFFVQLSSKDTDIPPGDYYFDIEIKQPGSGMVYRICTLLCEIEGGPTNRNVNDGIGQLAVGDEITILTLEQGSPIIIIAPAVAVNPNIYNQLDEMMKEIKRLQRENAYQKNQIETLNEHVKALNDIVNP